MTDDWRDDAACKGLTDLFFLEAGESAAMARAICRGCPVKGQCEAAGATELYGVWNGRTPKQRGIERLAPARAEITHCPSGHPYNEENTRWDRDGHRRCRKCNAIAQKTRYRRSVRSA